jgi:hypothetical protein
LKEKQKRIPKKKREKIIKMNKRIEEINREQAIEKAHKEKEHNKNMLNPKYRSKIAELERETKERQLMYMNDLHIDADIYRIEDLLKDEEYMAIEGNWLNIDFNSDEVPSTPSSTGSLPENWSDERKRHERKMRNMSKAERKSYRKKLAKEHELLLKEKFQFNQQLIITIITSKRVYQLK